MALTKKEYLPGDTLTAEKVNEIQDAIVDNENNKLDKSGGTLTGNQLGFNNNSSVIYSGDKWTEYYNNVTAGDESNRSGIRIQSDVDLKESIKSYRQVEGTKTFYNIYGEHNKPRNSYRGTGSATLRSIETGALGMVIFIWSSYGYGFVTPAGGVFFTGSTSQTFSSHQINYSNGILYITSDSDYFNGSDYDYHYQCL